MESFVRISSRISVLLVLSLSILGQGLEPAHAGNVIGAAEARARADAKARGRGKPKAQVEAEAVERGDEAEAPASDGGVENPMFYYTHLNPSPYTLRAGQLVLSTDLAIGITDFLQVGTNLISDFYRVFNANAKVALLDYEDFALAATGSWQSFNYRDIDSRAPDRRITSWMPGLVGSYAIAPAIAFSLGGNLNFTNQPIDNTGVPVSGFFRGAAVEADMSWLYYRSRKGFQNVLAAGVSYDFDYELFGFGVSHYFKAFKLGVHYYPNSTNNKFVPIIGGSAAIDF